MLNETLRITTSGYELEAGPRYAEVAIRELDVHNPSVAVTPGVKEAGETREK